MTLSELPEGAPIMTGTFARHHQPIVILFDFEQPIALSVQSLEQ
jgi:hypothetical protein